VGGGIAAHAACRTAQVEELDLGGLQLVALDGEPPAALCQLGWLRRLFLGLSAEFIERGARSTVALRRSSPNVCCIGYGAAV